MLTHTYYPGYTVPSPVAEGVDSYDPPVEGSKKPWYETKPLDEVRAILAESLPILMRRKTPQEVEELRRRGVSQLREGNFTGDHWQALAYLEQKTGKHAALPQARSSAAVAPSVTRESPGKVLAYYYDRIPDRDIPPAARERVRRAYDRACLRLFLRPGERPDMAIVSESRVRGPGTLYGSQNRVRGFSSPRQDGGIGIVLAQEPLYQMETVCHELYHWHVYVRGVTDPDEEEHAEVFGHKMLSDLAYG